MKYETTAKAECRNFKRRGSSSTGVVHSQFSLSINFPRSSPSLHSFFSLGCSKDCRPGRPACLDSLPHVTQLADLKAKKALIKLWLRRKKLMNVKKLSCLARYYPCCELYEEKIAADSMWRLIKITVVTLWNACPCIDDFLLVRSWRGRKGNNDLVLELVLQKFRLSCRQRKKDNFSIFCPG